MSVSGQGKIRSGQIKSGQDQVKSGQSYHARSGHGGLR